MSDRPKIIVLDDDPTGSQTVHSCLLLLKWDVETLQRGLQDASPIFFVLTNTRALPAVEAERVTREVCRNLKQAIAATQTETFLVVSRSDSTLRGHYPVETDAIAAELGPFDAHFMVPAFFAAGRVTIDSTHYIDTDGQRIPVHETEFARDSAFGYHHSYLPDYVAEKTQGRIAANQVCRLTLADLRGADLRGTDAEGKGKTPLVSLLMGLSHDTCVAVDAEIQTDLDQFSQAALAAAAGGKRFLFRSAASLLTSLAQLPPQPVPPEAMSAKALSGGKRGDYPGVVLVGSHVHKTTQQLSELLKLSDVTGIEVDVAQLRESFDLGFDLGFDQESDRGDSGAASGFEVLRQQISAQVQQVYDQGQTPVVYTSRQELAFATTEARLAFGVAVSALLMAIVDHLPPDIGFLISKGGITSNDTLSQGLALTQARLLGQIIPGVSVVKAEATHPQFPHLPVVLFPGNVATPRG
ncbi:MAG: four-carbon acid sugar kinase family protein [Synechococcales cyanobacterium CRU_2_2]|nr:four-carbon acid sugar kinase family protein [Synechococcales cyanobacterium CRU_2_2]